MLEPVYQAANKYIRKELTVPMSEKLVICIAVKKYFVKYVSHGVVFT